MIRVAVIDDQELVRSGIAFMLRSHDEIDVVGEAGDGEEAVALVTRVAPDVVLIEFGTNDATGFRESTASRQPGASSRTIAARTPGSSC